MALEPNHKPGAPSKKSSPVKDVKEKKSEGTDDDPNHEKAFRKFGGKAARDYYDNVVKRRKRKTLIVKDWTATQATSEPWGLCVSLTRMFENVELNLDVTTFGRNPECTVNYFNSATISGLHCQLRKVKDKGKTRVYLKDFSTNGTFLNRKKLSRGEEVRIRSGEEFWLFPNDNPLAKVGYIFYLKEVKPRDSVEALKAPQGQVTFVFTDVQSSTTLWEQEAVAMDKALAMHDHIFRTLILKFKGFEVKTEGDAFMVTFYNILDAVKWCLAVQDALNNHIWPDRLVALKEASIERSPAGKVIFNGLRVRMGINTGRPFCRVNPVTNRMDYYGPVVNCSARVSDSAHGGQIVCTQEVADVIAKCRTEGEEKLSPRSKEDFSDPLPSPSHGKSEELNFPVTHEEIKLQDVEVRYLETMNLKGISDPVKIYDVTLRNLGARKFPPLRNKKGGKKSDEDGGDGKDGKQKRPSGHLRSPTLPTEDGRDNESSPSSRSGLKTRPVSPQPSPLPTPERGVDRFNFHSPVSPQVDDDDLEREPDFDARLKIIRDETIQKLARNRTKKPSKSFILKEPLLPDSEPTNSSSSSSSSSSAPPAATPAGPRRDSIDEDLLTPLPTSLSSLSVSIPTSPPPRRAPSRPHSSSVPTPPTPTHRGSTTPRQPGGSDTPRKIPPARPPAGRPLPVPSTAPSTTSQPGSPRSSRSISLNRPAPPQRKAPGKPKVPTRAPPRLPSTTTV